MESIYSIKVTKFFYKYKIKRFKLPSCITFKNLYSDFDKGFIAKFNNKTFNYKVGSIISKSEYQMILHLLELELDALGQYPAIYAEFEYDTRFDDIVLHTINAPKLDPSKHIACHMRPIIYKHNDLYHFKLVNNYDLKLKCGQRLIDICKPAITTSIKGACETYYKYGEMSIEEYIEKNP